MSESVDDFLAHYGVRGMKWGQRKATPSRSSRKEAEQAARRKVMKDKTLDEIVDRNRKEKQLKKLLDDDLYPNTMAAKRFTADLLKENQGAIISTLVTGASVAAGIAFMAIRLNRSFSGISISPIPLR